MVFALSTLSFSVKSNQNTDGVLDFYILHEMRIVLVNHINTTNSRAKDFNESKWKRADRFLL